MADDVDPTQSPTGDAAAPGGPVGAEPAESPLPAMADLDRVSSELDDIDARLVELDRQRP